MFFVRWGIYFLWKKFLFKIIFFLLIFCVWIIFYIRFFFVVLSCVYKFWLVLINLNFFIIVIDVCFSFFVIFLKLISFDIGKLKCDMFNINEFFFFIFWMYLFCESKFNVFCIVLWDVWYCLISLFLEGSFILGC